jgi:hypothetical protein
MIAKKIKIFKERKMNQFEGIFEVFDISVRRLANGNKLRVVLECQEDLEVEKGIIEFRGDNVKVKMSQSVLPENVKDIIVVDTVFEVFDIKCRRLRNGDKLSLILEQLYEKDKELDLVKLRYNDVKIFLERIEEELFDDNVEIPDVEVPEEK